MKTKFLLLLFFALTFADSIQTEVQISGKPGSYSINTADNYSWQTRTEVYQFQYAKVSEISRILSKCLSSYGSIQINDQMNMVVITEEMHKLSNMVDVCKKLDVADMKEFVKLKTETIQLNFTQPSTIKEYLTPYLSQDGSLQSYNDLNLFVIHDHDDVITRVKEEIKKFDISPREFRIDFDVVELVNSDFKDNGINWDELFSVVNANAGFSLKKSSDNDEEFNSASTSLDPNTSTNKLATENSRDGWSAAGGVTISTQNFKKFLRVMVEDGAADYVSKNSISVLNNKSSSFSFTYGKKSVSMTFTPNLLNDQTVKLSIRLSVNGERLYESTVYGTVGEPKKLVSFQNVDSSVTTKKVPGLGTILPFIFSRKERGKSDSKLDIVFTVN